MASEGYWRSFWELDSDHLSRISRGNGLGQFCGYTPLKAKIAKSRPSLEHDGCLQKTSCRTCWQISARSPRSVSDRSNRSNQHRVSGLARWRFWPDLNFGHFELEQPSPCQTRENGAEASWVTFPDFRIGPSNAFSWLQKAIGGHSGNRF